MTTQNIEKEEEKQEVAPQTEQKEAAVEQASTDAKEQPVDDKARIAQLEEDLLRAKAENQNTIRRMRAEADKAVDRGVELAVEKLLDIVDSLERSVEFDSENHTAVMDGIAMSISQLTASFNSLGIETIEPEANSKLDPNLHLAISKEKSVKIEDNRIVRVVLKGYRHKQRILRPASVIMSIASKEEDSNTNTQESNSEEEK